MKFNYPNSGKRTPIELAVLKKKARVVSLSLLANVSVNKNVLKRFKLGMCDWTNSDSKKENDVTCDCFGPFELLTCGLLTERAGPILC